VSKTVVDFLGKEVSRFKLFGRSLLLVIASSVAVSLAVYVARVDTIVQPLAFSVFVLVSVRVSTYSLRNLFITVDDASLSMRLAVNELVNTQKLPAPYAMCETTELDGGPCGILLPAESGSDHRFAVKVTAAILKHAELRAIAQQPQERLILWIFMLVQSFLSGLLVGQVWWFAVLGLLGVHVAAYEVLKRISKLVGTKNDLSRWLPQAEKIIMRRGGQITY
jgi:hypothetical protein